jgi:hypothetical protein
MFRNIHTHAHTHTCTSSPSKRLEHTPTLRRSKSRLWKVLHDTTSIASDTWGLRVL